jgi:hypothetical protein
LQIRRYPIPRHTAWNSYASSVAWARVAARRAARYNRLAGMQPSRLAPADVREPFERVVQAVVEACRAVFGDRLVSAVLFGSVARRTPRPDSDVDMLLVVDPLAPWPAGGDELRAVEQRLAGALAEARRAGVDTRLSAMIKSRAGAEYGAPPFLDMTEDGRILFDRDDFMRRRLDRMRQRLKQLGSRRIWASDGTSHWDLKPDYRPGDVIEL